MRRCLLSDAGAVNYFLDKHDSTKKASGAAAVLDGADGQVMVRCLANQFVRAQHGDKRYFFVGSSRFRLKKPDAAIVASAWHPAFFKNGSFTRARFIGAYKGADDGGTKVKSVSNAYPLISITRATFRTRSAARGAGWQMLDTNLRDLIGMLYITELGDFNAQSKIGAGRTNLSGGTWTNGSYRRLSGVSNAIGNGTGNVSVGGAGAPAMAGDFMSYRGIEDWFGHIWEFLDGANVHNSTASRSRIYTSGTLASYADNTDSGFALAGLLPENNGYAGDLINAAGFFPSALGGNAAVRLCDYYYTYFPTDPDSGWRVVLVGGNANNGANAGPWNANSNNSSANTNTNIGRQLSLCQQDCKASSTVPLGKKQRRPHKVLVLAGKAPGRISRYVVNV
jgi:hypothetical protein